MIPLLPLLSMLPTVIDLFNKPSASKVLDAGVKAIETVTDAKVSNKPEELSQHLSGLQPEQQEKVIELMMKDKAVKQEIEMAWLENTKDARKMYRESDHKTADSLADRIMKWNLPVILILVVVNIVAVLNLKEYGELIAIISNFIGIAIGQLFNERQAVVNFFFGSSKSSRDKDSRSENMGR